MFNDVFCVCWFTGTHDWEDETTALLPALTDPDYQPTEEVQRGGGGA
jgi:hypothetical protein